MLRRIVNFRQAEAYLAARQDLPTYAKAREYLNVWDAETRRRSFFSARVASADVLSELHRRCQAVVDGDMTDTQARELLRVFLDGDGAEALRRMGFLPQPDASDSLGELASVRRLKLVLYQNAKIATEVGHYRQWAENRDLFPYGRWRLGPAENHRDAHVARDGKVYAFDHPIWRTGPPGSEFNCHCWREELTAEEASGLPVEPNNQDVPRPTVDFDPGAPLDVPPPVKTKTPPGILRALQKQIGTPGAPPAPVLPPDFQPGQVATIAEANARRSAAAAEAEAEGFSEDVIAEIKRTPTAVFRRVDHPHTVHDGKGKAPTGKYLGASQTILMHKDAAKWNGRPSLWHHEMGHHVDARLGLSGSQALTEAIAADYSRWQKAAAKKYGKEWQKRFEFDTLKANLQTVADHKATVGIAGDSLEDQSRYMAFFDTIAGVSGGQYGWGHPVNTAWQGEAIANVYQAQRMGWTEFAKAFPKTWKVVRQRTGT